MHLSVVSLLMINAVAQARPVGSELGSANVTRGRCRSPLGRESVDFAGEAAANFFPLNLLVPTSVLMNNIRSCSLNKRAVVLRACALSLPSAWLIPQMESKAITGG